jgi:hypothetical protein
MMFSFRPHICLGVATSGWMCRLERNRFLRAHIRLPGWPPGAGISADGVLVSAAHLPGRGHVGVDVPVGKEGTTSRVHTISWRMG